MKPKLLQFIIVALIAALSGYYFGVNKVAVDWKNLKPNVTVVNKEPLNKSATLDMSLFWSVYDKLENTYYDKSALDSQKMLNGAITGMISSLDDPFTVYLPPTQNNNFKQGMAGQFEGIGAELGMKDNKIVVISPLDNMPAQKAGIRAGDIVMKVDEKPTDGWNLGQTVDKVRGPRGTTVELTVLHKDTTTPVAIKIVRGTITVKSVDAEIKDLTTINNTYVDKDSVIEKNANGSTAIDTNKIPLFGTKDKKVAYIRLSQFGDNTNNDWVSLINDVNLRIQSSNGKVKGIILDLRNNPGGYLTDATFIASEFLPIGNTVVIQEASVADRIEFKVTRKGLLLDIPMIVLINKGSASAAEIVSGALRDYKRAKLVGEVSFGKGTVQQAEDLGNGAGIHITIAKWLTPLGTWVHKKGLTPDVAVALDTKNPNHDAVLDKAIEMLIK